MADFKLSADGIAKTFDLRNYLFKDLDFSIQSGEIKGIIGPNGSGKTTLIKTLCGNYSPDKGKLTIEFDNKEVKSEDFNLYFGLVSPYLTLYEEFTPEEHLKIFADLRGVKYDESKCDLLLKKFAIKHKKFSEIKQFSSGQKQRMKYVLALQHSPQLLLLDEPMSNLDQSGIDAVKQMIAEQIASNGCVVIATNDEDEKQLCNEIFDVTNYR
jgi:heme exporter protein A